MSGPSIPHPEDPRFVPPNYDLPSVGEGVERTQDDLFRDTEKPSEGRVEEEISFLSSLPPPKRVAPTKKPKPDADLLQSLAKDFGVDQMDDPEGVKEVLKGYALYYENMVAAGKAPPISRTEEWTRRGEDVENALAFSAETANSAYDVYKEIKTTESLDVANYLSTLADFMMDFRATLYEMMADDGEISAALTKASRENTISQIETYQQKTLEAREESRRAADHSKKVKGIVGWILAAIAAVALAVVSFGSLSPLAAVGVASLGVGLGVTGGNLIAESFGKPSLNTIIADAIAKIDNPKVQAAISGLIFAVTATLAIVSFGTMSGMSAGLIASSTSLIVAGGLGGTIGSVSMSIMTEAFLQSVTENIKQNLINKGWSKEEAEKEANKIAQAIFWVVTALVIVSSFGGQVVKGGAAAFAKAKNFVLGLMEKVLMKPGHYLAAAPEVTKAAEAAAEALTKAGTVIEEISKVAPVVPGAAPPGGNLIVSTTSLRSALNTIGAKIKALWQGIGGVHGGFKLLETAGKLGEAAVSFSQYHFLMKQATAVISQAEYEEVLIVCRALQKLFDTAIQALLSNQAAAASQAGDMESFFVKNIATLSQSLTAIFTASFAGLSSAIASAPSRKKEIEEDAAAAVAALTTAGAIGSTPAVLAASPSNSAMATTPELKQRLALLHFMSVVSQKLAQLFQNMGWEKGFSERMAREIAPLLLKALASRGTDAEGGVFVSDLLQTLFGGESASFTAGTDDLSPQPFMEGDAPLIAFMNQLKDLQSLRNATPQQFAAIMANLSRSLFKLRKEGEKDQINDIATFIDALLGEGGLDQLAFALDPSQGDDLGPVLQRLIEGESPGDEYRLYSPA